MQLIMVMEIMYILEEGESDNRHKVQMMKMKMKILIMKMILKTKRLKSNDSAIEKIDDWKFK